MGFPKIRHSLACELIVVLLAMVSSVAVVMAALAVGILSRNVLLGILTLVGLAVPMWKAAVHLDIVQEDVNLIFRQIRNDQIVRPEYITDKNGRGRGAVEQSILLRLRRFGKWMSVPGGTPGPLCLCYQHENMPTNRRLATIASIDTCVIMYSVNHLTERNYETLLEDAGMRCKAVKESPVSDMYGPAWANKRARFRLVILLADTVEDNLRRIPQRIKEPGNCWVLPCVAECSSGKYYVDLSAEMSSQEQAEVAAKFDSLPEQFLFGGHAPVEQTELDWIDLDMSLWSLMRQVAAEQRLEFGGDMELALRLCGQMKNREIRLEQNAVFCKLRDHLAVCPGTAQGNVLTLTMGRRWLYRGGTRKLLMMSDEEREQVRQEIADCLKENGYEVCWEN